MGTFAGIHLLDSFKIKEHGQTPSESVALQREHRPVNLEKELLNMVSKDLKRQKLRHHRPCSLGKEPSTGVHSAPLENETFSLFLGRRSFVYQIAPLGTA